MLTAVFIFPYILSSIVGVPLPVPLPADGGILVESVKPYEFGYEFGDRLGTSQYRKETADSNGLVQGNYGYVDPNGTYRNVEYKADADGYRATIKSNEQGLVNQNSADAVFIVEPPPSEVLLKASIPQGVIVESI